MFDTREMGFNNPSWTWSELEAALSGRKGRDGRAPGSLSWNAGGDSPAWGRKRQPFEASHTRVPGTVPYAELHCHSNYSFLDGASHPEELVDEAARLGLEALALTDHNGFYGVVRFAEAARAAGLPTVFGTELTLTPGLADTQHVARAEHDTAVPGRHRRAARRPRPRPARPPPRAAGRRADRLRPPRPRASASATWRARRGRPSSRWPTSPTPPVAWCGRSPGAAKVPCRRRCSTTARRPPAASSNGWSSAFGRDRVLVELWDHGDPIDSARNDALAEIAHRVGVECIATNNVHYASPAQRKLATAIAAVRARRSLDEVDPWLPGAAGAHLRSGAEQERRFARYPGVVELAAEIGRAAAFDLSLVAPNLPPFPCPDGI